MGAKPERIQKAQREGDIAYLKAAGRRGALNAAKRRRSRADEDSVYDAEMRERTATQEAARIHETGEDIISPSAYE
jgi:hypothetical protein